MHIEPFTIRVPDELLSDLRTRIRNTRWPDQAPGPAWAQGTDLEYLKRLLSYWAEDFDWPAQERQLNTFKHFRAELGDIHVHLVHERAREGDGIPLILKRAASMRMQSVAAAGALVEGRSVRERVCAADAQDVSRAALVQSGG